MRHLCADSHCARRYKIGLRQEATMFSHIFIGTNPVRPHLPVLCGSCPVSAGFRRRSNRRGRSGARVLIVARIVLGQLAIVAHAVPRPWHARRRAPCPHEYPANDQQRRHHQQRHEQCCKKRRPDEEDDTGQIYQRDQRGDRVQGGAGDRRQQQEKALHDPILIRQIEAAPEARPRRFHDGRTLILPLTSASCSRHKVAPMY